MSKLILEESLPAADSNAICALESAVVQKFFADVAVPPFLQKSKKKIPYLIKRLFIQYIVTGEKNETKHLPFFTGSAR